jgi:TolB protein
MMNGLALGYRLARFLPAFVITLVACVECGVLASAEPERPLMLIGYNEHRTNLPGGRQANVSTNRAMLMNADGTERRALAIELADQEGAWTQFAGWSPDGKTAVVGRGWESVGNAKWEEEHKSFRFTAEGWLYDSFLVDLASGESENVTAVDRVSFYNSGLFFWPNDASKLGFTALIAGNSKPFRMDRDGRNKTDLTQNSSGFAYGFSGSPDGSRISYHENYQVYLADADGSNRIHVQTGHPFVFAPTWSPDGKWLLFVSGEHYNCHPHIVRADGGGLRKLADRAGYRGAVEFLDVPDYHAGSSDVPVWSTDSQAVFYTAQVGESVELFCIALDGAPQQLTKSRGNTLHYHPKPSPDGQWILYGSKRDGVRNLYRMRLSDRAEYPLTSLPPGHAAMHAHWQPLKRD